MVPDAGYDPVKDFVAISQTSDVPLVLVVNPALPVKTVKEFIALAKRRPGELTVAASGSGSTGHVATAMFSSRAGIKLLHVQYKGAAPAVVDLVGGHVMLRFDQVTTSLPTSVTASCARSPSRLSSARPCCPTCRRSTSRRFRASTIRPSTGSSRPRARRAR